MSCGVQQRNGLWERGRPARGNAAGKMLRPRGCAPGGRARVDSMRRGGGSNNAGNECATLTLALTRLEIPF